MINMENNVFDKFDIFKLIKDRYDSLYIFVLYDVTVEECLNKVQKMIGLVDQIQNPSKKSHIKKRLHVILDHLSGLKKEFQLNCIYFLENVVNTFDLIKEWKQTLIHFKCDNFCVKYGDIYNLDWLKNYLCDTKYTNVIHVKNNDMKHYHLNSTKKRIQFEMTSKNMDIAAYVAENIPKQICIIHGVSATLKNLSDCFQGDLIMKVYKCDKHDDDILGEIDILANIDASNELESWLSKLLDPKDGKKIVFGKDITNGIQMKLLKTLYCSPDMEKRIKTKVPLDLMIFDIQVVKTFGDDVGKKLVNDFRGAVGIKFY